LLKVLRVERLRLVDGVRHADTPAPSVGGSPRVAAASYACKDASG
jgi:hypothetical protein